MILSHKQIEEIAAAVTKDFNEFFFGKEADEVRIARATPIPVTDAPARAGTALHSTASSPIRIMSVILFSDGL